MVWFGGFVVVLFSFQSQTPQVCDQTLINFLGLWLKCSFMWPYSLMAVTSVVFIFHRKKLLKFIPKCLHFGKPDLENYCAKSSFLLPALPCCFNNWYFLPFSFDFVVNIIPPEKAHYKNQQQYIQRIDQNLSIYQNLFFRLSAFPLFYKYGFFPGRKLCSSHHSWSLFVLLFVFVNSFL